MRKTIALAKKLIAIKSTDNNPNGLEEALGSVLSNVKDFTVERFEKNGYMSALVYVGSKRPNKFKIILNGHLDVLPGKQSQFQPFMRGDRLYGIGSMDMKTSVASLTEVFCNVAKKVSYPLGLQLVTDEEVGGYYGTKYQIEQGVKAEFVIAGESTNLHIANRSKGVLWLKVTNRGKTGHSAYPWMGKNAIWEMMEILTKIKEKYPIPSNKQWVTTINLASLRTSNTTYNKIPDTCESRLDIRYIAEEKGKILKTIMGILPKSFSVEIIENENPLLTDEDNVYVNKLKKQVQRIVKNTCRVYAAQGTSDGRHYSDIGCGAVEFGPVGGGIGTDNEWVSISSLEKYKEILTTFLTDM